MGLSMDPEKKRLVRWSLFHTGSSNATGELCFKQSNGKGIRFERNVGVYLKPFMPFMFEL